MPFTPNHIKYPIFIVNHMHNNHYNNIHTMKTFKKINYKQAKINYQQLINGSHTKDTHTQSLQKKPIVLHFTSIELFIY